MSRVVVSEQVLMKHISDALHEASGHHIVPPVIVRTDGEAPNWRLDDTTPDWVKSAIQRLYELYDLAD